MNAARLSPGAISESSPSHLPPSEASTAANPVTFPPGRSSRGTMPLATGCGDRRRDHLRGRLKYLKSGGGWSFLAGIKRPSPLRK